MSDNSNTIQGSDTTLIQYLLCASIIFVLLFGIYCVTYPVKTSDNKQDTDKMISKNFYETQTVCPELDAIYENLTKIKSEVRKVRDRTWPDWPERELYDKKDPTSPVPVDNKKKFKWNIYPFTAFGVVVDKHCKQCPELWKFLQSLPGCKAALLSRLGPGTKLNTHQGWGGHSNNVIRCHFGFDVPKGCYVSVRNSLQDPQEIRLHRQEEWICFDDSRHHYAHNPTDRDRIVLIVDIERPLHIKPGTSDVEDTAELMQIVDYFKEMNQ